MEFTFGVVTYNQEEYVLETLESIKYQKITYGKDVDVFLYIADDSSKDNTVLLCKKWLDDNKDLFKKCDLIASSVNEGTVRNHIKLLNIIDTDYFKVIAGDDLFSHSNLFESIKDETSNNIHTYIPLILKGDDISLSEEYINKYLYFSHKKRNNKYDLGRMMIGSYFNTPSFFPKRSLIKDSFYGFMKEFILFDDDPMWYLIIKENDVTLDFKNGITTIYRVSESSVSNSSKINKRFVKDYVKLLEYYMKQKMSVFTRIYVYSNLIKNRELCSENKKRKITLYKIINKIDLMFIKQSSRRYKTKEFEEYINSELNSNAEYYRTIKKNATELYSGYIANLANY